MEAANAGNQEEHSNSSLRNDSEQNFSHSAKLIDHRMLQRLFL
jgi:hypothetical protein